ncbi:unnamed protein product [Trichobilharzia szidati]|nr:unnamed protein product [Trichobilharzia szidati]
MLPLYIAVLSFKYVTSSFRAIFHIIGDCILCAPAVQRTGLLPSVHWTIERVLAVGMLPLYPIAIYMDTPMMNFIVVTAVSIHSYWGFDGVIKDYAFERRYGPALMPILRTLWKIMCGFGFGGLLYFNFNDVGFISAVKKLWAL